MDKYADYWGSRAGEFLRKGLIEDVPALLKTIERYSKDGAKLLEVGCGAGRMLEPTGATGIDFSEEMLKKNKFYPERAKHATAEDLPFEDKEFDIAFTHSCFMHIPMNIIEDSVREIQRVAKIVILSEWNNKDGEIREYMLPNNERLAGVFGHDYVDLFRMPLVEEIKLPDARQILVFKDG